MKIGFDAMGGDFAPDASIGGALLAQEELPGSDRIVLIGDKKIIRSQIEDRGGDPERFDIVHAADVITMGDPPTRAFSRKPDSSIVRGFRMLKCGHIDAFSSAGNTGAMLVGSIYSVNAVQGVIRPATTGIIPQESGGVAVLIDVGTNPDTKPDVLYQFGLLGSIYARYVYGIQRPRVGLLNIGGEADKGSLLCQSAFRLMNDSTDYHFIGNVESRDFFRDKVDVIVCDGFTGNVVLKNMEAMFRIMVKRGLVDDYFSRFNYENYGGTPILGVNSTVLIGHGISNETAFKNMILHSKSVYEAGISDHLRAAMDQYTQGDFSDLGDA